MLFSCLVVLFVYFLQIVKKPPRNWKNIRCQKILKCGDRCWAVATQGNHIAVSVSNSITLYDKNSSKQIYTIGKDQLSDFLPCVTFYNQEYILVSDSHNSNIKMFTIQGQHVHTIDRGSTPFKPRGIILYCLWTLIPQSTT